MLLIIAGCGFTPPEAPKFQTCNASWFAKIEAQINTGDTARHGPDLGSLEWRSVIEFKLNIRGNSDLPSLNSQDWCDYIDKNFITNNT